MMAKEEAPALARALVRLFNAVIRDPGDVFEPLPGSYDPRVMEPATANEASEAPAPASTPKAPRGRTAEKPTPQQDDKPGQQVGTDPTPEQIAAEKAALATSNADNRGDQNAAEPPRRRRGPALAAEG